MPKYLLLKPYGNEDSKTTLEIYAHVQKRLSRPQVKRAKTAGGPREWAPNATSTSRG